MKKFSVMLAVCAVLVGLAALVPTPAFAGTTVSVSVSTYPVTASVDELGDPVFEGSKAITSLTLSNSGATAQTVTFYDLGGSTSTPVALFTVVVPAVAGFYRPVGDIDLYSLINATDLQIRKSSTTTDIHAYLNYQ